MTVSGYNQILSMIDRFTKLVEATPCQTASAEETCNRFIKNWIALYVCLMTFVSDNGQAFVGDLTKELMRRSHSHSTTYHPQTNGLVERQNRTLMNMLRVYILLEVYDKLGQTFAAMGGSVQLLTTLNSDHQSFHDADR